MWHGSDLCKFMGSFLYRSKCYPSVYSFLFLLSSWNIVWCLELQHPSCNHAEIKDILLQKSQLWHSKTIKARPSNCLLLDPLLYVWALWISGWNVDSGSAGPGRGLGLCITKLTGPTGAASMGHTMSSQCLGTVPSRFWYSQLKAHSCKVCGLCCHLLL